MLIEATPIPKFNVFLIGIAFCLLFVSSYPSTSACIGSTVPSSQIDFISTSKSQMTTHGYLRITGISVNRINLALKEIDVEIGILRARVNGPFNFSVWAPFREGGPTYSDNGTITGDPPWHEVARQQWKWLRFISIETMGFCGLNSFPFEKYETEIVFASSASNITTSLFDPYLSWELEQQGYWTVDAFFANTSYSTISDLNATHGRHIKERELKSFISLFICLEHPEGYRSKMWIPTWGLVGFTTWILIAQFTFLRKKMKKGDHISMFVAVAVFTLGTIFTLREMTPPELIFPELSSFVIVIIYSLILFATILGGHHKTNESENKTISEEMQLKETKTRNKREGEVKQKPESLEDKIVATHARFLEAIKEVYPLAVLSSLSIAIAAFARDTLALASTYAIASAALLLIAFICSLVVKFLPNVIYTLASYVFTAAGVAYLFLVILEFAKFEAVFHIVSSIGLLFTLVSLSTIIFYYRRIARSSKFKTIRLAGYATIFFGLIFIVLMIPVIYAYCLEVNVTFPSVFFVLLPLSLYGFTILGLLTSILVIARYIEFAIKRRHKAKSLSPPKEI